MITKHEQEIARLRKELEHTTAIANKLSKQYNQAINIKQSTAAYLAELETDKSLSLGGRK